MLEFQAGIFKDFGGLFGNGNANNEPEEEGLISWDDNDDEPTEPSTREAFNSKWGWYIVLRKLAGGDFTKIDEIVKVPLLDCLYELVYQQEEAHVIEVEQEIENQRQKHLANIKR